MKNLIYLFLLIISSDCYSQKLKKYIHSTDGFEIEIPKRWVIGKQESLSLYVSGEGKILIHIQPVVDESLDVIYKDYVNFLNSNGNAIQEIGEETINERKYRVYYKSYITSGVTIKVLEYFTIKENKLLTASFLSYEEKFTKLEPLFKRIASTLKY